MTGARSAPVPVLVFHVDGSRAATVALGVEVTQVLRIVDAVQLFPVPLTPFVVRGMLNHQGRIITVIDTAALCGWPAPQRIGEHAIVLRPVNPGQGHVALQTFHIEGVVPTRRLEIVETGGDSGSVPRACGWSAMTGGRLVHVLDAEKLHQEILSHFAAEPAKATRQGARL